MVTDAGSNRFYARIPYTGAAPATVKLRNISDNPASTSSVAVTTRDITITQATFDGAKLTVAATSKSGGALTIPGVGPLPSGIATDFPMTAPPASVTVTQGSAKATQEVLVTDGAATTPLPTIPPSGTVDPTPGGDTSTSTGGTVTPGTGTTPATDPKATVAAAQVGLIRGATATLDASGSTNAKTFAWTRKSGPDVTLTGADTAKPTVDAAVPGQGHRHAARHGRQRPHRPDRYRHRRHRHDPVDCGRHHHPAGGHPGDHDRAAPPRAASYGSTAPRLSAGAAKILTPQTQVVIYDTTPGRPVTKLGTSPVDTLGGWSLKPKPGPTQQVTSVRVQSTRGGAVTASVATR